MVSPLKKFFSKKSSQQAPQTPDMAPYTTAQTKAIADFRAITNLERTVAARYLKASNWDPTQAINSFYNNPGSASPSNPSRATLSKLFDKCRDDPKGSPDTIAVDGTIKYFEALGVDLSDVASFVVSEILQCPTMGEITREGFVDGWSDLGVDTIEKQKKFVQQRRATLGQPANGEILKKVYKHTFKLLITDAGQRSVKKEMCIDMWQVLFVAPSLDWRTPTTNWLELWVEFVQGNSIKMINMDVWQQTLKFAEESLKEESLAWWSEESAWPALVDEFVEWIKEKRGDNKEENMEDVEY